MREERFFLTFPHLVVGGKGGIGVLELNRVLVVLVLFLTAGLQQPPPLPPKT